VVDCVSWPSCGTIALSAAVCEPSAGDYGGLVRLEPAQTAVLGVMCAILLLSALACWYFSTRLQRHSPGRLALILLTGFVFLVNLLWGAVYYVACEARLVMTFEGLVDRLWVPVLMVSLVGLGATGLVSLLIVRREVGSGR